MEKFKEKIIISEKEKKIYLKELELSKGKLKKFVKSKQKSKDKKSKKEYAVYRSNFYAKLSNYFMENLSFFLTKKYPNLFKSMFSSMQLANFKILTKSYISIILFTTLISIPISLIFLFIFLSGILTPLVLGFLIIPLVVFSFSYYYPFMLAGSRAKDIDGELVFAIVHMSAVAGSGAHPVKIFELIVDSGEYKEVEEEFKKILNYLNLFGYSLSNSLRIIAISTPSNDLKELLNGMASTIETGGDMKAYLADKSDDALIKYRLEQRKHLESLQAYSEVYVGILIAAPLLFVVTLAILEKISPVLFGIPISYIALLGTFILLPLLNILFILFLESSRSDKS